MDKSIKLQAARAATEPSAQAVVICLIFFARQSPATNTPGVFVSQSSPDAIYPRSSSSHTEENTPFDGRKVTGRVDTTIIGGDIVYQYESAEKEND